MDCVPSAKTRRGPSSSSSGLAHALGRAEAVLAERRIPRERVVLGDQNVGVAVAGEVHELAGSGRSQSRLGSERERAGTAPSPSSSCARRSPGGAVEVDEIELAVACEIEELPAAPAGPAAGWRVATFHRRECGRNRLPARLSVKAERAQVALVEPATGLPGENARRRLRRRGRPTGTRVRRGPRAGVRGCRRSTSCTVASIVASLYSNSSGGIERLDSSRLADAGEVTDCTTLVIERGDRRFLVDELGRANETVARPRAPPRTGGTSAPAGTGDRCALRSRRGRSRTDPA